MIDEKYGVVYTPSALADFVTELLLKIIEADGMLETIYKAIDPACGAGSLLYALKNKFGNKIEYIGMDIDAEATTAISEEFSIYNNDSIIPEETTLQTAEYWKHKLGDIQLLIANPPWSSEKIYSKTELAKAGFELINGQYDSYILFIELNP